MAKYILRTSIVAAGTLTLKLAIAQNVDDTMFDGLMQSAPRRAAQVEWHKIPPNEIACINRGLRQQGASVYDLINRGILPFDSQILELRSICSRLPSAADVENLSSRPTLNCENGRTLTAKITCLDANAAAADWDLISAYWARYFSLPQGERQDFEQAQQRWLQALNETCGNRPQSQQRQCVLLAYHSRAAGYRSQLNEDAIAESRLTPEQHAKIQRSLATLGLLDGTPNGEFGPNTRAAIKRFQAQSGSNEAIFLSPEQRAQLLRGTRLDQPGQQLPSRIDDKNPTDQSAPSQANNGATQSPVPTTKTQSGYSDAAGRRPQGRAEQVEATPQRAEANTRQEKPDSTSGLAISLWQQVRGIPSWLLLALLAITGVECFTSLIKGLAGKKVRDPAESVLNALKRQRWQGPLTLVLLGSSFLIAAIYSIAVATAMVAGGMWFIWIVLCRCNIDAELFADCARFETAALQLAKRYESTGGQPLLVKFVKHWRTLHGRLRFLVWSGRSAVVLITPACWWARFGTTYSMGDTKSICWNETKHTERITNPSALEEIVEETWEHATESGERDNRYKENRRVFVVQRYDIRLYLLNGGELVVRSMTPSGREAFLSALCEMIGNNWNTFNSEEGDAGRAHESDHARYGNWGTHVDSRKWYEVLQVAETAEMEVIKSAYRRLVKTCHPDRIDKSLDVAFQDLANRKLQELNAAYEEAETLRGLTSNIPVPG